MTLEKPDFASKSISSAKQFNTMNADTIKAMEEAKQKEAELLKKEEELRQKEEELKQRELNTLDNKSTVGKYKTSKKEERRKTSLNLPDSVFNKLITLSNKSGYSITKIVEDIITEEVKSVRIDQDAVTNYYNELEKRRNKNNNKNKS